MSVRRAVFRRVALWAALALSAVMVGMLATLPPGGGEVSMGSVILFFAAGAPLMPIHLFLWYEAREYADGERGFWRRPWATDEKLFWRVSCAVTAFCYARILWMFVD